MKKILPIVFLVFVFFTANNILRSQPAACTLIPNITIEKPCEAKGTKFTVDSISGFNLVSIFTFYQGGLQMGDPDTVKMTTTRFYYEGSYEVKVERILKDVDNNNVCPVNQTSTIPFQVFANPSGNITRVDPAFPNYCTPVREEFNISCKAPFLDPTKYVLYYGDGSADSGSFTIANPIINRVHMYNIISCNTEKKKFVPVLVLKNECVAAYDTVDQYTQLGSFNENPAHEIYPFYRDTQAVMKNSVLKVCTEDAVQFKPNVGAVCGEVEGFFRLYEVDGSNEILIKQQSVNCKDGVCDTSLISGFPINRTYKLKFEARNICTIARNEGVIVITAGQKPKASLALADTLNCYPVMAEFINNTTPKVSNYEISFGDGMDSLIMDQENFKHLYFREGIYEAKLRAIADGIQCVKDTSIYFSLNTLCQDVYVPNAFIPNSHNDELRTFKPVALNLIDYKIEIYNLYGQLLWQSNELIDGIPAWGWDGTFEGKNCPQDTYIWKVYAVLNDGTPGGRIWEGQKLKSSKKKQPAGTFVLLR